MTGFITGALFALSGVTVKPRPPLENEKNVEKTIALIGAEKQYNPFPSERQNSFVADDKALRFEKDENGHFHTGASVNGKKIKFLIDTGASLVAFSRKTALEAGLLDEKTRFSQTGQSAGGHIRFAEIILKEVKVGPFTLKNVPAAVTDSQDAPSLLGMSFLKIVPRIVIENDKMRFEK